MPRLPLELLRIITEDVEKSADLARLSLVSWKFNYEAERRLYHSIGYCTPDRRLIWNEGNSEAMLQLVQDCPRRWGFLVRLNFYKMGYGWPSFKDIKAFLASHCHNLKTLILPIQTPVSWIPPPTASFRLHTFSFRGWTEEEKTPPPALSHFLESQPDIRDLSLLTVFAPNLSPGSLPKLERISGCIECCLSLIPARAIRELKVIGSNSDLLRIMSTSDQGAMELAHLESLTLPRRHCCILPLFGPAFPRIRHLDIMLVCVRFAFSWLHDLIRIL